MIRELFPRTFNVRFFACLLAIVAVFGIGVHFLHGFQVRRNASSLLDQADRTYKEGDYAKAKNYLKAYLKLQPRDDQVRARYALLLADEDKVATAPQALAEAFYALEDALLHAPERTDLRRRSIDIALKLGNYNIAAQHLDLLLQGDPNNGVLEGLRAQCYEATGDFKEARKHYENALRLARLDLDNYSRLAYLLRQHAQKALVKERNIDQVYHRADDVMEDMIQENKTSYEAWLRHAHYYKSFIAPTEQDRARKIIKRDLDQAWALKKDSTDVLLEIADWESENNDPNGARAKLKRGLELDPKDWRLYRALAQLEVAQGDAEHTEEALKVLRRGVERLPRDINLLWNLGLRLIQTNHREEAADIIERLRKEGFPAAELDYLTARDLFLQEKWRASLQMLERIYPALVERNSRNQQKDWFAVNLAQDAKLLSGICYEQLGDSQLAASAYQLVLSVEPRSIPALLGAARMEWALGRFNTAIERYRRLLTLRGAPREEALVELARVLIVRNLQKSPSERARPELWGDADRVLTEAEKLEKVPVEVPLLRADIVFAMADALMSEGQVEKARAQYEVARKVLLRDYADPANRPAKIWVAQANLEERKGNAAAALALLNEAEKFLGDRVELRLAKASYWVRQKGPQATEALASLATGMEKLNKNDRLRLMRGLATAHLQLGEKAQAARLLEQLAQERKDDLACRITLFDLAWDDFSASRAIEDRDAADKRMTRFVKELQEIEADEAAPAAKGTLWKYCQAAQIIVRAQKGAKEDLSKADELLRDVAEKRSSWSRVPVCQAQLYELLNKNEAAIAKYKHAVDLGERDPAVIRRGVEMLSRRQRYLEADKMLQKLAEQSASFEGVERQAAEVALHKHDTGLALSLAQKAVPVDSNKYEDQLWLGHIQWAAGLREAARAPFTRAIALAPQEPAVWVAYIHYLARMGDKEKKEAQAKIEEARQKLPKKQADLALAQCYMAVGDMAKAGELFQSALAADPKNKDVVRSLALFYLNRGQPKKALPHLQTLISLKGSNTTEANWEKRVLAMILVSQGTMQQRREALAMLGVLEGNDSDLPGESDVEVARAKAAVLFTQPGLRDHQEAIKILERLCSDQTASRDDLFLLARLYESIGDWTRSKDKLNALLLADEDLLGRVQRPDAALQATYVEHLAHLINQLLVRRELTQAQAYFDKLEKIEPSAFGTLAFRARLQAGQKKSGDAVPAIQAYVQEHKEFLEPAAYLLEQIDQPAAALEMFQRFVEVNRAKKPEVVLVLARFLGRQQRTEEALELCDKAWASCSAEDVGRSAVTVLSSAKPTREQCQRVAGWLERELARDPKKAKLIDQLALIRNLQGDHARVIENYRRIVDLDGANAKALNNLAWQLAFQDGGSKEALGFIQKAIDLGGPRANRLDTRAIVYLSLGQGKEALKDLEEVIAADPSPQAWFHKARAFYQLNDRRSAQQALQRAKSMGLTEATLDPLERPILAQLRQELEMR
jgi:tetratricopeptide (TPR) repeat protein